MMTLFHCNKTDEANLYHGNATKILEGQGDTLLLRVKGKTYDARKQYLRALAVEYSWMDLGGLSYGELAEISAFFERNGKRYGLLEEFRENAIV